MLSWDSAVNPAEWSVNELVTDDDDSYKHLNANILQRKAVDNGWLEEDRA